MGTVCAYCFVRVLNLALPLRGKNIKGGLAMVTKGRDSCKCIKYKQNVQVDHIIGDRGGTMVKVLCYKPEGRWFDPSLCHWNFSLT